MKPIFPKEVSSKGYQKMAWAFTEGKRKVSEVRNKSREPLKGFIQKIRTSLVVAGNSAISAVNIIFAVMKDGWHAYIITARSKPSFAAVSVIPPAFIAGIAFEQRNLRTASYGIALYTLLIVFLMSMSGSDDNADVLKAPEYNSDTQEELEADTGEAVIPQADADPTVASDSGNERIRSISDEDSWETV